MNERPCNTTLDPDNWDSFRVQSHCMLDDMLNYISEIREKRVWQPIPDETRQTMREPLPQDPSDIRAVHRQFLKNVLPFTVANSHPGFMGWVQGGGTPVAMLGDMLAAGLNANLGGRDQMPIEVERQVLQWVRELFGFPEDASGLFVTGSSLANFIGVLIARTSALGIDVRDSGLGIKGSRLVAYTSAGAHGCVSQAIEMAGLGTNALRVVATNSAHEMDLDALKHAIATDRRAGLFPFLIVASAGTVDVGAVDDLSAIAEIASGEDVWFHVDGAYGALGMLSSEVAPRLRGIENADSIAFDFHKWAQVQYDAGFILVRHPQLHIDTFAAPANYLRRESRGISAASPWPCDFGPDLSRSFKALKVWFSIKVYGAKQLGQVITNTCNLAQYMKLQIEESPRLELMAPVALNIVCFRYRSSAADVINANIVISLQESGYVAPSTTLINGKVVIRAAIVNHRTTSDDIDMLIQCVIEAGDTFERNAMLVQESANVDNA